MDPEVGEKLAEDGWVVVDLLPDAVVVALAEHIEPLLPSDLGSFWASAVMAPRPQARAIDQDLKRILGAFLATVAPGLRVFLGSIIAKGPRTDGVVAFHQDWTFTDEQRHPTVLCWVPLTATHEGAGALRVVRGSHRWSSGVRPSGESLPTDPFPDDVQQVLADRSVTVPMRAGQGLLYVPGLLHASWPNGAGRARVALNVALTASVDDLVHFHADEDGTLRGHRVPEDHFTVRPFGSVPTEPAFAPWAPMVTVEEIRRAAHAGPRPGAS